MKWFWKLQQVNNTLMRDINQDIAAQLNMKIASSGIINVTTVAVRKWLRDAVVSQREYESIVNNGEDTLKELFGIRNARQKIESLIDVWSSEVDISFVPFRGTANQIKGSLFVSVIDADFTNVLQTPEAWQDYGEGEFNWLEWLLLKGDQIVVAGFDAVFNPSSPSSRTGHTLMMPSPKGFRVPPHFSGTRENNFITRAVEEHQDELLAILMRNITAVL